MSSAVRIWCALCQWPDREPFLVGSFPTPARGSDQEARDGAIAAWRESMGRILPADVPLPDVVRLIPGAIILVPEGEAA